MNQSYQFTAEELSKEETRLMELYQQRLLQLESLFHPQAQKELPISQRELFEYDQSEKVSRLKRKHNAYQASFPLNRSLKITYQLRSSLFAASLSANIIVKFCLPLEECIDKGQITMPLSQDEFANFWQEAQLLLDGPPTYLLFYSPTGWDNFSFTAEENTTIFLVTDPQKWQIAVFGQQISPPNLLPLMTLFNLEEAEAKIARLGQELLEKLAFPGKYIDFSQFCQDKYIDDQLAQALLLHLQQQQPDIIADHIRGCWVLKYKNL